MASDASGVARADASRASRASRPAVVVIGGGMSGLAAARSLYGAADVLLLEASDQLGGKVRTGRLPRSGAVVELGPDQYLRRDPSAEQLCRELGLGDLLVAPATRTAGIVAFGRMHELPEGLVLGIPTDLDAVVASGTVSAEGVERARADASSTGSAAVMTATELGLNAGLGAGVETDEQHDVREQSAGALLRARLGNEVVDRLVDPMLGGINAGSVDSMSLSVSAPAIAAALVGERHVIPALARSAAGSGVAVRMSRSGPSEGGRPPSPFLGLRGGLGQMVEACATDLLEHGVELRCSAPVAMLERASSRSARLVVVTGDGERIAADGVVLATPGHASAAILERGVPDLAAELGAVAYASVAVLTLAYPPGSIDVPAHWSGVLVPRVEGTLMTAATWLSQKWPWMAAAGLDLVRVSAGRAGEDRIAQMADDDLAAVLCGELERVLGHDAHHSEWQVTRFDRSFPQYRPGHRARMARVAGIVGALPGLELGGAVLGGIGIPACISSGAAAGDRLLQALAPAAVLPAVPARSS